MSRDYEHEIKLSADQPAIWAALTDAEELGRWLVEVARVEPRVGGMYELAFGDGVELQSRIEVWEPGRRLRLSGPGPIIQEYTLTNDGDATILRVVTSGIPDSSDWDDFVEGGRRGWEISLRTLQHYLEYHRGEARRVSRVRFDTPHSVAESWERATGAAGLGGELDAAVLISVPRFGLIANIAALDDALLALGIQSSSDGSQVWIALSTYGNGTPPADVITRWTQRLERALDVASAGALPRNADEEHGHG